MKKTLLISGIVAGLALVGAGCTSTSAVPATPAPTPAPAVQPAPAAAEATSTKPTETIAPAPTPAVAPKPATTPTAKPAPKPTTTKAPTTSTHRTQVVTMTKMAFSPQVLAVAVGDTVVWSNKDTVNHTSVSDNALIWDSGNLKPGSSYSRVFNAPGTYTYHCGAHPSMTGSIIVYEKTN